MGARELSEKGITQVTSAAEARCRRRNIPGHLRDDCVQESLKIAVVIARSYPAGDFPRMVWSCVRRGVANAMRQWFGHETRKAQGCGAMVDTLKFRDPTYAEVDVRLTLDSVVDAASGKDARVLMEFRGEDLNYRQVAYRLGCTKAQVSHAIERTRELWRDRRVSCE